MDLTLGQAAKLAGVSKTTISKAIATGRLSARKTDVGSYAINVAELQRVYTLHTPVNGPDGHDKTPAVDGGNTSALMAQIDGLKAQLALMQDQVDDLKAQRDRLGNIAEQAQRLLADQRPARRWFFR